MALTENEKRKKLKINKQDKGLGWLNMEHDHSDVYDMDTKIYAIIFDTHGQKE